MKYKLIAFDMDGTLVEETSCWEVLHRHFGTKGPACPNLEAYERGEIDYSEFMRQDIALWQPLPRLEEVKKALASYTIAPNVREVVAEVHRRGYQTAIVTGGLDFLADDVARELRIPHVLANGLEVDKNGRLTGEGIFRVEPSKKDVVLAQLAERIGVTLNECVAVGDSKYDVKFLEAAGLAVAIGKNQKLVEVSDVVIEDFSHFPRLLDYL